MAAEITQKIEVWPEAALAQHAKSVTADWKHADRLDVMMLVEVEARRAGRDCTRDGAPIEHGLAVILAGVLEPPSLNSRHVA